MVCFAIAACLEPTQNKLLVSAILQSSGQYLLKLDKNPEFRENAAAKRLLCAGSRHATIAKQTILKNFRILPIHLKNN